MPQFARSLAFVALVAALAGAACKSEQAPKPATEDKDTAAATSTYTNPWVNPYTDTSTYPGMGGQGGMMDDGLCQSGMQPVFTSTGGTGTTLQFYPGSSVNWTFQARDAQAACVFEVYHVDAMGLPTGITVTNNDSAQVTVMGVANNTSGGGGMPSGSLTVKARNITACARASSDYECRNYFAGSTTGSGFDVTGTYQWTLGTGSGATMNNNSNNSSNMAALGIGMQLISMLLGGGGSNPLAGRGGLGGGGLPVQPGGGSTILPTSTFTGMQTGTGLQQGSCIGLSQQQCQANTMCSWDSFSNSCR